MPRHIQTYLDGYNVKVASMDPEEAITDTTADVELIFHSEDMTDVITVPVPAAMRPKLAALLVGMLPDPEATTAGVVETPGEALNVELDAITDGHTLDAAAEAAPAGRCSRCGARGEDELDALCPNAALITLGDQGAVEGFAENGCVAAIHEIEGRSQDPAPEAPEEA